MCDELGCLPVDLVVLDVAVSPLDWTKDGLNIKGEVSSRSE